MKKTNIILIFLSVISIITILIVPIAFSKYFSTSSDTITLNIRKPVYYLKYYYDGTLLDTQEFTYGISQNIRNNTLVIQGKTFTSWNTLENGTGTSYFEGQSVNNLSSIDGTIIDLYAQFENDIPYLIKYNSNSTNANTYYDAIKYEYRKVEANASGTITRNEVIDEVSNIGTKTNDTALTIIGTMADTEYTLGTSQALSTNLFEDSNSNSIFMCWTNRPNSIIYYKYDAVNDTLVPYIDSLNVVSGEVLYLDEEVISNPTFDSNNELNLYAYFLEKTEYNEMKNRAKILIDTANVSSAETAAIAKYIRDNETSSMDKYYYNAATGEALVSSSGITGYGLYTSNDKETEIGATRTPNLNGVKNFVMVTVYTAGDGTQETRMQWGDTSFYEILCNEYEAFLADNIEMLDELNYLDGNNDNIYEVIKLAIDTGALGDNVTRTIADKEALYHIAEALLGTSYSSLQALTNNGGNYHSGLRNFFTYSIDTTGSITAAGSWPGLKQYIGIMGYPHMEYIGDSIKQKYTNYPLFFSDGRNEKGDHRVQLRVTVSNDIITSVTLSIDGALTITVN